MKPYAELLTVLQTQSMYDVLAERDPSADPKTLDPATLNLFVNCACLLGDIDEVLQTALDNPLTARLPEDGATMLLYALYESGNGAQLPGGRVAVQAGGDRPNTIGYAAACLLQAGDARQAMDLFVRLIRRDPERQHPGHQRFAFEAICRAYPEASDEQLRGAMRQAFPKESPGWIDYGLFRRRPTTERAMSLPAPDAGMIQRGKHIGSIPPESAVRVALPEEYARYRPSAPTEIEPERLARRIKEIAAHVAARSRAQTTDGVMAAVAAVRERYAPQAGGPVQVVSTGRAGTTALFELLDASKLYTPFHSYAWITAPRHRWAMIGLLSEPSLNEAVLDSLTDLFLTCRGTEWLSAYRAGRTPVLVSHWDAVFAPILAGLFPDARFLSLRRDVDAVINSMIRKRQFAGAQLVPLPYADPPQGPGPSETADPSKGSQRLIFSRALYEELPFNVAWYLAFTEKLWSGLGGAFPERAEIAIESDALFRGEADALAALLDGAFPESGVSPIFARTHFSRPINEKPAREMPKTERVEAYQREARRRYDALIGA